MKVITPAPNRIVAEYVDRILVIEDSIITTPFSMPLFANGTPTLLFITAKADIDGRTTNYLTLFGQTVFPETLTITKNFSLIAYFLKPFTLFSLFGVSPKELTDFPIDLNLLHQSLANELKEKLLNAGSIQKMIDHLDGYILALAIKSKSETQAIQYATSVISKNPSKETLTKVQDKLCLTERTFERLFDKTIGVSPNLFRRVCQFNAAFQQLSMRRFTAFTDIAFQNGYADQSHFIRAFKEFTHITPKQYLKFGEPPAR